jgi:hypothetical protein
MKKRITWFALTLIMAMAMIGSSVMAAVPTETQGEGDGTTSTRMQNSSHIATITMDKCFEVLEGATTVDSFEYIIEKIRFWDNSNVSTSENGTTKTKADMPIPKVNNKELTAVGDSGDAEYQYRTTIGVTEEDATTNNTTGNDGANVRTGVEKTYAGKTKVTFDFQRPGYYIYKFTEVNKGESGVTYDNHTYYLAFYVANKTKDNAVNGETQGGTYGANANVSDDAEKLYVHTITAWRSQAEGGTNEQIITQEVIPKSVDPAYKTSNKYYLKMKKGEEATYSMNAQHTDVFYKATKEQTEIPKDGDGNITAEKYASKDAIPDGAYYWVEVSQEVVDQMVARGEVGKVDRSKETNEGEEVGPNKLPINWWNESDAKDISVVKRVTGTLGDLNKEFEFTVELTGLISADGYEVTAQGGADLTKATGLTKEGEKYLVKGTPDATKKYDKTFTVKLKAGQKISVVGLPVGATYKVTEAASDHVPSFAISGGQDATIAQATGNTNNQSGTACATAVETVDASDSGITITYTNHRDFETETGIPGFVFPIVLIGVIALIGLAVVRRRSNVATVNDFEF